MTESTERKCLFCGEAFVGFTNKRYCCTECRIKMNNMIQSKRNKEDLKALKAKKPEPEKKPVVQLSKAEAIKLYHNYAEIQKQKTLELIGKIGD